jgi:ribosome-associated protein
MIEPDQPEKDVETIELDRFLKLAQIAQSGGEAKMIIKSGVVQVNGVVETRRGRKLRPGDIVNVNGEDYVIASDDDSETQSSQGSAD